MLIVKALHVDILLIVFTATTSEILSFSAVVCVHIPLYTQPNSPIDIIYTLAYKETYTKYTDSY